MSDSYPIKLEQDLIAEIGRIANREPNTFFSLADYYVYRREHHQLGPPAPKQPRNEAAAKPEPDPVPSPPPAASASPDSRGVKFPEASPPVPGADLPAGLENAVEALSLEQIQLTPVKVQPEPVHGTEPGTGPPAERTEPAEPLSGRTGKAPSPASVNAESHPELEPVLRRIYQDLDESFMYLGVLKKISLPDAMKLFAEKFEAVIDLLDRAWETNEFPEHGPLFSALGEDHEQLKMLVHAEDAINPIYEGIRNIFDAVAPLRKEGADWPAAEALLRAAFSSWQ